MDGEWLDSDSPPNILERPLIPEHLTDFDGRRILIKDPEIDRFQDISHAYYTVNEFLTCNQGTKKTLKMTFDWANSLTYPYRTIPGNNLFDDINILRRQGFIYIDHCLERFEHNCPLPVVIDNEIGNAMRLVIWTFGDVYKRGSFESLVEFAERLNRQGIHNQLTRAIEKLDMLGISFLERNLAG